MAEPNHIVVVDDEPEICEMLADYLGHAGFKVSTAENGAVMRRMLEDRPADLVILDINMPGEDGLSLARFLRANAKIGIVMLTAAGEVVDRIVGLEMGADDYLAEAGRHARAAGPGARRPAPHADGARGRRRRRGRRRPRRSASATASSISMPTSSTTADGEEVAITSMEFDLLKAFAEHPNRVLSRDQLLDLAHNRDWEPFDRSIDIRIARLRRKVETDPPSRR